MKNGTEDLGIYIVEDTFNVQEEHYYEDTIKKTGVDDRSEYGEVFQTRFAFSKAKLKCEKKF